MQAVTLEKAPSPPCRSWSRAAPPLSAAPPPPAALVRLLGSTESDSSKQRQPGSARERPPPPPIIPESPPGLFPGAGAAWQLSAATVKMKVTKFCAFLGNSIFLCPSLAWVGDPLAQWDSHWGSVWGAGRTGSGNDAGGLEPGERGLDPTRVRDLRTGPAVPRILKVNISLGKTPSLPGPGAAPVSRSCLRGGSNSVPRGCGCSPGRGRCGNNEMLEEWL